MRVSSSYKFAFPLLSVLLLLQSGSTTAFAEDRAVVIGVQEYANLPRANTLRGCVNDAHAMQDFLSRDGFTVTLLTNREAAKQAILKAIKTASAGMTGDDRFVLFFAGHGRDIPAMALMPSDAKESENNLTPDELYEAVRVVPARTRTVILDACFSAAMRRDIDTDFRARYYAPEGARSITPRPASHQDTQEEIAPGKDVCYWTASQGNEQAIEGKFGGAYHGVFTNYLPASAAGKDDTAWGDVHADVKSKVAETLGQKYHQNPTISPEFVEKPVFGGKKKPGSGNKHPQHVTSSSVWSEFNSDHVDPRVISISAKPDASTYELKDEIELFVRAGGEGYLVVIDKNVDGKLYRLFPSGRDTSSALVKAGQTIRLPEKLDSVYQPGETGLEHVKAMLFSSKERAEALILSLGENGATISGAKRLEVKTKKDAPFYTSEITFSVVKKGEKEKH